MEIVQVLGIDPSLRNTGLAIVSFNTEMPIDDPNAFSVKHCQVLVNPMKYKGNDAVLNMLDMMNEESKKTCYQDVDAVLIEAPAMMYNKGFASNILAKLGHISGGAIILFGLEKANLYAPHEWNQRKKKEVTHNETIAFLGDPYKWHYEKALKSNKFLEHCMDASSLALWWIKKNYIESE
jgi:hypothetical protein